MLTNGTKKRIDTARDILVGKLPDPKSQVEQITIALIYKFMDDMDKQSEELGGRAKFFTGEYAKYAWSKIFDPRVSGTELVGLYGEAIQRMNHNPNIPPLFRNIFKNAYLPYRAPETLKSFLKTIGEFEYDHSEKLGDAFEYLLSIMGSQGDAGQFRTPRHIIDFIIKVVDPKKNETILDPACGTAGFLISSYKHILEKNKKDDRVNLTPDEKKRLIENFSGYDISPDMVRLSLVNMYLHKFQDPKIYEYDTLSSEERWQEVFDVILANPPFMSPKGGIKPHKRFSVQAKRSEVLFVDYISEHLTPNGRAGIIVPEGIIFQSGTAYKKLRKMLIEQSLYAVVSLPPGVFNPYSGVKTSILLLDKNLAKKTDTILFVKINNDGFGLGAQRREINGSDLPLALEILRSFCHSRESGNPDWTPEQIGGDKLAHLVAKTKIAESGDYNLSGNRYKETVVYNGKWDFVELGELAELIRGVTYSKSDEVNNDGYKILRANNISLDNQIILDEIKQISKKLVLKDKQKLKAKDIFICLASGSKKHIGKVAYVDKNAEYYFGGFMGVIRSKKKDLDLLYLFYLLKNYKFNDYLEQAISGVNINNLNARILYAYKIPLPPLEVQEQIVAELDNYQKIIDGAKQVAENYKPAFKIDPEWEMVAIGEACQIKPPKSEVKDLDNELEVSFVPMAALNEKQIHFEAKETRKLGDVIKGYTYFRDYDVLLAKITPCFENGKSGIARNLMNGIGFGSTEFFVFRANRKILPQWIYYFISNIQFLKIGKNNMTGSAGQQRVVIDFIKNFMIPLPPLSVQQEIVAQIEVEQKMVNANKEFIGIYEQKIKDKISDVWGE